MTISDPKSTLVDGLGLLNEQVLHKLDGLSEYDLRRPMTPTGTNLLGLVKHLASVQAGYFGATFGRPFPDDLPFDDDDPQADMYARADEPSEASSRSTGPRGGTRSRRSPSATSTASARCRGGRSPR